jgi:hypothetical protein
MTSCLGIQISTLLSLFSLPIYSAKQNVHLPILLRSGAAGFAWTRVEYTPHASSFAPLQDYYRKEALYAVLHEREISRCSALFQEHNIPCLFGKGWRVAKSYPGWGMRACGDIDVYVPEHHQERAQELIKQSAPWAVDIDLHQSCREFSSEPLEALWNRAEQLTLRGVVCRFIPPEEHLRLLAFHSLRHGIARPVWLLDIGFWLKSFHSSLDWARVTDVTPLRLEWLKGVIWLAHATLGFPLPKALMPFRPLPPWVLQSVYEAWGRPYYARIPVLSLWKEPKRMLQEIPKHWPNPIEAVYEQNRSFHQKSPTSQASVFFKRSRKLLPRLGLLKK